MFYQEPSMITDPGQRRMRVLQLYKDRPTPEEAADTEYQLEREAAGFAEATPEYIPYYLIEMCEEHNEAKQALHDLLAQYMHGFTKTEPYSLTTMISIFRVYLEDMHAEALKYKIPLIQIRPASELARNSIADHKQNVIHVIRQYENMLKQAQEEVFHSRMKITGLEIELEDERKKFEEYVSRNMQPTSFDTSEQIPEVAFMEELRNQMAASEALCSSMREQLQDEHDRSSSLQMLVDEISEDSLEREEKCMEDVVRMEQKAQVSVQVKDAIMQVLQQGLQTGPNIEDCRQAVSTWQEMMHQAIRERKQEIHQVTQGLEQAGGELSSKETELNRQEEIARELDRKITKAKKWNQILMEELEKSERAAAELKHLQMDLVNAHLDLKKTNEQLNEIRSLNVKYRMECNRIYTDTKSLKRRVESNQAAVQNSYSNTEPRQSDEMILQLENQRERTSPHLAEAAPDDTEFWELNNESRRSSFEPSGISHMSQMSMLSHGPLNFSSGGIEIPRGSPQEEYRRSSNINEVMNREYPLFAYDISSQEESDGDSRSTRYPASPIHQQPVTYPPQPPDFSFSEFDPLADPRDKSKRYHVQQTPQFSPQQSPKYTTAISPVSPSNLLSPMQIIDFRSPEELEFEDSLDLSSSPFQLKAPPSPKRSPNLMDNSLSQLTSHIPQIFPTTSDAGGANIVSSEIAHIPHTSQTADAVGGADVAAGAISPINNVETSIGPLTSTPFIEGQNSGVICLPSTDNDTNSVLLKSPHKETPTQVDVAVRPTQLSISSSGEHISFDMTLTSKPKPKLWRPKPRRKFYTAHYGVPPPITPSEFRDTAYTPLSVFTKHHASRRRLFGPGYMSPQSPWQGRSPSPPADDSQRSEHDRTMVSGGSSPNQTVIHHGGRSTSPQQQHRSPSPPRRSMSSQQQRRSPTSPRRSMSPQQQRMSPTSPRRSMSPQQQRRSPTPPRRSMSPQQQRMSPTSPRRSLSPQQQRRSPTPPRRSMSPQQQRRSPTPPRRSMSPQQQRRSPTPPRISPSPESRSLDAFQLGRSGRRGAIQYEDRIVPMSETGFSQPSRLDLSTARAESARRFERKRSQRGKSGGSRQPPPVEEVVPRPTPLERFMARMAEDPNYVNFWGVLDEEGYGAYIQEQQRLKEASRPKVLTPMEQFKLRKAKKDQAETARRRIEDEELQTQRAIKRSEVEQRKAEIEAQRQEREEKKAIAEGRRAKARRRMNEPRPGPSKKTTYATNIKNVSMSPDSPINTRALERFKARMEEDPNYINFWGVLDEEGYGAYIQEQQRLKEASRPKELTPMEQFKLRKAQKDQAETARRRIEDEELQTQRAIKRSEVEQRKAEIEAQRQVQERKKAIAEERRARAKRQMGQPRPGPSHRP